jgi:hypothetical protein
MSRAAARCPSGQRGWSSRVGVGILLAFVGVAAVRTAVAQGVPGETGPAADASVVTAEARRRGVQGWATESSITTRATLTNNANYGTTDVRAGDLILEVIPAFSFNREGGRLRVNGSVALDGFVYVDGTQVNSILPQANVTASLEAVENLFFIDASWSKTPTFQVPASPPRTISTRRPRFDSRRI